MKTREIKEAVETLIRCGVHKVQIPDRDIEFTSENIAIWIEQNLLTEAETRIKIVVEATKKHKAEKEETEDCNYPIDDIDRELWKTVLQLEGGKDEILSGLSEGRTYLV